MASTRAPTIKWRVRSREGQTADVEVSFASIREPSINVRIALSAALAHTKARTRVTKVTNSLASAIDACADSAGSWVAIEAPKAPSAEDAKAAAASGGAGGDAGGSHASGSASAEVHANYLAGASAKLVALAEKYPFEVKGWLAASLVAAIAGNVHLDVRSAPRVVKLEHSVQRGDDSATFEVELVLGGSGEGSDEDTRVFRLKLAISELPEGSSNFRWASQTSAQAGEGGTAESKGAQVNVPYLTLGMTDVDAAASLDSTLAEALDEQLSREVLVSELGCLDALALEKELAVAVGRVYDVQVARASQRAARVVGTGLKPEDALLAHMRKNLEVATAGELWSGPSLPPPADGQGAHFIMAVVAKGRSLPNRGTMQREARRSVAMQADEMFRLGHDVVGGQASKYNFFSVDYIQMVGMRVMSRPAKSTVIFLMENDVRNYARVFSPMALDGGQKATWLVPGPSNVPQLRGQPTIIVSMARGKDQLAMREAMHAMGITYYIARSARDYKKVGKAYPLKDTAGGEFVVIVFKPEDYARLAERALSPVHGVASIRMVEPAHMPVKGEKLFYWRSSEGAKKEQRLEGGIELSVYGVAGSMMNVDKFYDELAGIGEWTARELGLVTYEPGDVNVDGAGGRGKLSFHGVSPQRLVQIVDFFNEVKFESVIMDNARPSILIIGQELGVQDVLEKACGYCLHLGHATEDCPVRAKGRPGYCPRCFEIRVVPYGALSKFCSPFCRPPARTSRDKIKAQRRSRILGEIRRGLVATIYITEKGVAQMPSTRTASIMDNSGAIVQIAVVESAAKLNVQLQLAAEKVRHQQRQDERGLMGVKMEHMSEEGMHLWQMVQRQAAAMVIPGLSTMQQQLMALRACQLTANVSPAAVQLVLDLITMMHRDENGMCGQLIMSLGTPRLRDAGHTGVTPRMQMVAVTQSSRAPHAKRGLATQINNEEGRSRKNARAGSRSRDSTSPGPPKGGGAS